MSLAVSANGRTGARTLDATVGQLRDEDLHHCAHAVVELATAT